MDDRSPAQRSATMRAVKSEGNKSTEGRAEAALLAAGVTGWVKQVKDLPGRPDFYFPEAALALFVDGCQWHGCPQHTRLPRANADYWRVKIEGNRKRDNRVRRALRASGVHVMRVWEHDLKRDAWMGRFKAMLRRCAVENAAQPLSAYASSKHASAHDVQSSGNI